MSINKHVLTFVSTTQQQIQITTTTISQQRQTTTQLTTTINTNTTPLIHIRRRRRMTTSINIFTQTRKTARSWYFTVNIFRHKCRGRSEKRKITIRGSRRIRRQTSIHKRKTLNPLKIRLSPRFRIKRRSTRHTLHNTITTIKTINLRRH